MNHKPRKCKNCSKPFIPKNSLIVWCSPECGYSIAMKKKNEQDKKEWAEKKKQIREKIKTTSDYKADLQEEINAIVRLIDYGQGCIATGAKTGKMNAGHYISVGSNDTIRFHLDNIHLQSEHSNSYKGGDTIRYQDGIKKIYGQEYLDFMDFLRGHPDLHLTRQELKEKIKIARAIRRGLEKEPKVYARKERLRLRSKFNEQLGIYQVYFLI